MWTTTIDTGAGRRSWKESSASVAYPVSFETRSFLTAF